MDYEEYMQGEPEDSDELLGTYMIDEPEDIDLILMPKLNFDLDKVLDEYISIMKNCRNKAELKEVLRLFYNQIREVILLLEDIRQLQDKAKEIEFNMESMGYK